MLVRAHSFVREVPLQLEVCASSADYSGDSGAYTGSIVAVRLRDSRQFL